MAKAEVHLAGDKDPIVIEVIGEIRDKFGELLEQIKEEVDVAKIEWVFMEETHFAGNDIRKLVEGLPQ